MWSQGSRLSRGILLRLNRAVTARTPCTHLVTAKIMCLQRVPALGHATNDCLGPTCTYRHTSFELPVQSSLGGLPGTPKSDAQARAPSAPARAGLGCPGCMRPAMLTSVGASYI